ncbi:hypothetical protein [Actinophytocola sp. NPDC049390]|uniref:hypothetical protein n=1 Tax=Actinophytocola sp. NPDC049390 TaxID=3363894 RepID=UPI0037A28E3C
MVWDARRIVGAAVIAATGGVVWLVATEVESPSERPRAAPTAPPELPVGPEVRSSVSAPPDVPGRDDGTVPPGLDFRRPDQVAHAYLVAAHSLRDTDRDRTNRRVLPYLAPENPANPRGLVVADAPPRGQAVTAAVDDLRMTHTDEARTAIAYEASLSLRTGSDLERRTTYLVLDRQPDGRWLVRQETAHLQPGD